MTTHTVNTINVISGETKTAVIASFSFVEDARIIAMTRATVYEGYGTVNERPVISQTFKTAGGAHRWAKKNI